MHAYETPGAPTPLLTASCVARMVDNLDVAARAVFIANAQAELVSYVRKQDAAGVYGVEQMLMCLADYTQPSVS